ncbi:MAG: 6-hydroxycyclohex-1-ene-1-carbonyl-CoA dehydrogenase [Deltaproteobacteria bacterium]|nr:6-hydroxycyclohex-1-ene-1-carbonyl-CoA dehydrogenase [Deltaproteobacteria bacterium]
MTDIPKAIQTWQMVRPYGKNKETGEKIEGVLERTEIPMPEIKEGEVLVKIAGCGVCHTDISYFYFGVPTVNKPPMTLGHEITGTVIAGQANMIGKNVIIPAVMPCRDPKCEICNSGRGNRCLNQKMPGNSLGNLGGFSSHIIVPAADLCIINDLKGIPLSHYAVVADAGTTPYQAAMRADIKPGDLVIVTGVTGGVGVYMGQVAKALGAKAVVGIARNEDKLKRALNYGVDYVINSQDKDIKAIKEEFKGICKANGLPNNYGWKIFECTGTAAGQDIGLNMLSFVGKLVIVGFGMQKNEYSMSRLMAFDADIIGTWGCLPEYYPKVLDLVQAGKIAIEPFLETRPMSQIKQAFADAHSGKLTQRIVLEPDF